MPDTRRRRKKSVEKGRRRMENGGRRTEDGKEKVKDGEGKAEASLASRKSCKRNIRLVWVDPNSLGDNPHNWRTHSVRQKQSYISQKEVVRWAGALLYNEATGHLIDGHMRKDLAVEQREREVPVLMGNWTPEEEKVILATLDPISAMAHTDEESLKSLSEMNRRFLDGLRTKNVNRLKRLNSEMEGYSRAIEAGDLPRCPLPSKITSRYSPRLSQDGGEDEENEEDEEEEAGYTPDDPEDSEIRTRPELKDEVFFSSTNEWQIPDLLPELIATPDMLPVTTWDRHPETIREDAFFCHSARRFLFKAPYAEPSEALSGGTLGFFTDDWRFEHVYEYPSDFLSLLLQEDWTCILSPDFSGYRGYPFPMRIWQLYRSRWCARYWQEAGIRIVPTIQGIEEGITLESLPQPCPVIAFQCRTLSWYSGSFEDFGGVVSHAVEVLAPEAVLIYGGNEHRKKFEGYLPSGPRYVLLDSYMGARKRKRGALEGKTLPRMGAVRPNNRAARVGQVS